MFGVAVPEISPFQSNIILCFLLKMPTIDELGSPDEDTLRILVSTDNHVGYLERDPVRALDSFAALEEVLYLAKKYNVRVRLFLLED